eukprot:TRINITY_DN22299_c0_g1_i4.p2 TRINITY_DN22299_c0_g1~~TRINITY_DN22299_c0_g1_i4.p2  ORF type:complete len:156 (+),score=5.32 TRINITY_DN22299_c0_g1_i4:1049-1516(+)
MKDGANRIRTVVPQKPTRLVSSFVFGGITGRELSEPRDETHEDRAVLADGRRPIWTIPPVGACSESTEVAGLQSEKPLVDRPRLAFRRFLCIARELPATSASAAISGMTMHRSSPVVVTKAGSKGIESRNIVGSLLKSVCVATVVVVDGAHSASA